jgi:hypothetical protein
LGALVQEYQEYLVAAFGGMMNVSHLRKRFWVELGLGLFCAVLAVLTMVWPDWIELVSGFDPDNHSGAVEAAITIGILSAALLLLALSRVEWHRAVAADEHA